jgi:tRNA dimethylallyltransferase
MIIFCYGSGLYVNAVLKGFDEFSEIDSTVREDVTDNYEKLGVPIYKNN